MVEHKTIDPPAREEANGRRRQARKVMPLIGALLDSWEALPNDVRSDPELKGLMRHLSRINDAMGDA